jgi:hypothetical protein
MLQLTLLPIYGANLGFLGPIFLRSTIKDEKDLVFKGVFFCLVF